MARLCFLLRAWLFAGGQTQELAQLAILSKAFSQVASALSCRTQGCEKQEKSDGCMRVIREVASRHSVASQVFWKQDDAKLR